MRIDVPTLSAAPGAAMAPAGPSRLHRRLVVLLAVVILGGIAVPISGRVMTALREWTAGKGHGALREDLRLTSRLHLVPGRIFGEGDPPWMALDLGFKKFEKIRKKRSEALKRGILFHEEDDWVKGAIRHEGGTTRVKMRLKGDWTDHLENDRWSFRIHVRDGEHILGLRRFSIQHPNTRGFQAEVLFYESLRQMGVMTPRYTFVSVSFNGRDLGLMAMEEHFAKELMEDNGRPESVILRFDESNLWASIDRYTGWRGAFDTYVNARVEAFGSGTFTGSESLAGFHAAGVGLLRGFASGALKPSEVFDVERLGAFLAVAELWGSWHSRKWNNQRFYYNPLIGRLEPVAFDGDIQERHPLTKPDKVEQPIVGRMLSDQAVFMAYRRAIETVTAAVADGSLTARLRDRERAALGVLQKEFWFLEEFPWDELPDRAKKLRASLEAGRLRPDYLPPRNYPALLNAYLVEDGGPHLELSNAVPHRVEVREIEWRAPSGEQGPAFGSPALPALPILLEPTALHETAGTLRIPFEALPRGGAVPVPEGTQGEESGMRSYRLRIRAAIAGEDREYEQDALDSFVAGHGRVGPGEGSLQELQARPFVSVDGDRVTVGPGTWEVRGDLLIPSNTRLVVSPGTTLRFQPGAVMVSRGAVDLAGTAEDPVILEGSPGAPGGWAGLVIIDAGSPSTWTEATVRGTTGIVRGGWRMTGGVTFLRSDAVLRSVTFQGHTGEDALNVVHSRLEAEALTIRDCASDALDADFSEGVLTDARFERVGLSGGGDGFDLSGSSFQVTGGLFSGIPDKAFSVGERSRMTADGVTIRAVGIGVASKDGSRVEISDSKVIDAVHAGLMAYVKKPAYGEGGSIVASGVELTGGEAAVVQTGSRIEWNGLQIEEREVDVELLYETVMKPGLSR